MPFIKGQLLNGHESDLPWVNDGTSQYIPNFNNLINYSSGVKTGDSIIKHSQVRSMLAIFSKYSGLAYLNVRCDTLALSTELIEMYKNEKILPSSFDEYFDYRAQYPGFQIVINTKNSTYLFEALDEYHKDEKFLSMGLQESAAHKVRVYKGTDEFHYIILTNKWTFNMARKCIAMMPKLFPFLTIPEDMLEIFRLFGTEDFDKWCDAYNTWVQSLNLMETERKNRLIKALNANREAQINNLKSNIQNYNQTIDSYVEQIRNYAQNIQKFQAELFGFENKTNENGEDFYDYLKKNKSIRSFTINGNVLYLIFRTAWNYFDQTFFDQLMQNQHSYLYRQGTSLPKVLSKIYCENPRFELWTETAAYLKLDTNAYHSDDFCKCTLFYQQHIYLYNCWGNNKGYIQKALSNKEYMGAVEQMVAATKNINWLDSPVIEHLVDDLAGSYKNLKTIKDLKTGEFISYLDALDILNQEEQQKLAEELKLKEMQENEKNQDNGTTTTPDTTEIPANAIF